MESAGQVDRVLFGQGLCTSSIAPQHFVCCASIFPSSRVLIARGNVQHPHLG